MIENNTLVRHKKLGYEGVIDGETRLKILFTGAKGCEWQYRIKIQGQDKRFIAPEEDLEIKKDKGPKTKRKPPKTVSQIRSGLPIPSVLDWTVSGKSDIN